MKEKETRSNNVNKKIRLTFLQRFIKRSFDITFSLTALIFALPIILISALIVFISYGEWGIYSQERVGLDCKRFRIYKIRTMTKKVDYNTNVTTDNDPRITKIGRVFRKTKIDELPQLINVLMGKMSIVGPRPDVEDVVYSISIEDREIFTSIRPGVTGPATLKYKNEEEILANVANAEEYNLNVLFPDKVKINKEYIQEYSFIKDIKYIVKTIM